MDYSTLSLLAGPFPIEGMSIIIIITTIFVKFLYFNANNVDPDQTPH